MASSFAALLTEHLIAADERQELARGVVGGRQSSVDLHAGTAAFADGPTVPVEILASGSTEDGSWYWAWSNPGIDLPDERLDASRRLAAIGDDNGVAELTAPLQHLDALRTPHSLGAVASGLLGADAYYLAHNGPFVLLLMLHSDLLRLPPLDGSAVQQFVMGALGRHKLLHDVAIEAFLRRRGAQVETHGDHWDVIVPSGETLIIRFDRDGRCTSIDRPAARISTGTLVVRRAAGGWRDRARRYEVHVDGESQAALRAGESAALPTPVGTHDIQLTLGAFTSRVLPVLIRDGETIRLAAAPAGTARLALKQTLRTPAEYLSLRPAG